MPENLSINRKIDLKKVLPEISKDLEPVVFNAITDFITEKENLESKLTNVLFSRSNLVTKLRDESKNINKKDAEILRLTKIANKLDSLKISNTNLSTDFRIALNLLRELQKENVVLKRKIQKLMRTPIGGDEMEENPRKEIPIKNDGR
jgi:hypothetical protein